MPTTTSLWSGMLLVSTGYRLRATAELPETVLSAATISIEWHSPHLTMTMICLVVTAHKAIRGDGGTTPLKGIYHHDTTPRTWEAVLWHTLTT